MLNVGQGAHVMKFTCQKITCRAAGAMHMSNGSHVGQNAHVGRDAHVRRDAHVM